MVAPSSGRCGTFLVLVCLLLKSLPSDGQFTVASSFIPPAGVRSSVNNHLHNRRFNIRAGDSFTITCDVQHNSLAFIAELYLDGRSIVITDGLLPDTTYSKTGTNGVSSQINLELTFDNFQAVHNGRYDCFANTTDGSTTSFVDSRLYGTGPITVTLLSSQYLILYSDEDIVIPTQIRGEFYDIDWIYHATDPLLANAAGREKLIDGPVPVAGVGNVRFSQELVITMGTTPHVAGYYAPEIRDSLVTTRAIMTGEIVLVRAYASPMASLPTVGSQSPGADLTVTCTATGYPEPTISFSTSDISANTSMGEHVTTTTATPSAVYTTTRTITFSGLLASDCGMVTCTASHADRDGTQTATDTTPIQVIDSPDVTITPSADQAISTGGSLTLSCEAEDCTTTSFVYMWYRDGVNVENGTSLSISNSSSSDFGRYECNATGDGGTGSAVIYISEQNSLTLTSELSAPPNPSLSTVEGSSVDHYNIESQATFSISCTFESPNDFDLEASKDGVVLSTNSPSTSTLSSPTRTSKTLTIQLSSFSTSDNGVYLCNASNSDRELLSRRVLFTTGALSAMRVSEEFIELAPPNSLQLEVSVDGAFSSLQWYRGSQQLMEGSGGVSFSDFSRSLTISNTSSSDAGQYQLIASDNTTNVSIIFEVQVFLEPNFTISTTPEVVVIEDSVDVTCSAQSFPEPFNLRLVFNGSNLTASSSSPAEFSDSSRQFSAQTVYTISSAQPDDHKGNYTCTVEVTRGSPSSTATYTSAFFLDVNGPTAPNVTVDAMPESVSVGDSGVLVCQASGGQPASYSFSWSNSTGDTVSSGVTSSGSRSTLNITEAADDDFDTYTCTVSSAYWNVSASGDFTELDLPLASLSLSNPDPVVLGASVGLDCSSVGRAPFNLSILVNGQVLASRNEAGRAEDLTYVLLISDEANYTEYICQAVNMFGSDNTTVTIVRATPPNVTAVSELEQTVTVDSGFTLQAEISGYNLPIDSVMWQRGSEALNSSGQFNISSDTGTLGSGSATLVVQSTASLVDDAQYTLTVTNPAGNDTMIFGITIQIAPSITFLSEEQTILVYASVSISCTVDTYPPSSISWYLDGQAVDSSRVTTVALGDGRTQNSTLSISSASTEDSGTYRCRANNSVSMDTMETQLTVENGCPMETSVGCSNVAPIVWPETEIGQEVVVRCPCGPDASNPVPADVVARRRCQGTYSQGAVWESEKCTACEFSMNRRQMCSLREDISPADNSSQPEVDAFTYISYIGCSISVVTLVIFIVTYLGNKKLRDNLHLKLLINLSITLVGLYVTFIITDAVSSYKEILPSIPWPCAILSALLQYFFLCYFIAMGAIVFNLVKMLYVVLESNITSYFTTAVVITWVIPLFVVAISMAPKYQYYTGEIIANETMAYCRPQSWPFYLGVALPFILVFFFNLVLFIVIGIKLIAIPTLQIISLIDAGKFRRYKENYFLTIGIAIVLSLTWIFGLLATGVLPRPIAIPFVFLFTIFASIPGLSILVFYGCRRSECRQLWRDWLCCRFSQEKRDRAANRLELIKARREASILQGTRSPRINCCLPSPATRLSTHNNATSVMPPAPFVDLVYENETVTFDLKETKKYAGDCIEMRQLDDSSCAFHYGVDPITGDDLISGDVDKTDSGVTLPLQDDCTVIANKEAGFATTDLDLGRDVEVWRVKMDSLIRLEAAIGQWK